MSLPVRERGLKQPRVLLLFSTHSSLPVRERGLKPIVLQMFVKYHNVAPRAGAWIETSILRGGWISKTRRSPCGSVD